MPSFLKKSFVHLSVAIGYAFVFLILYQFAYASFIWTDQSISGFWVSITSSSDGTKLAAVINGGDIWTSTTSGATWTDQTAAGSRSWRSITSSSDGTKLAAVADSGGDIWTSTTSGATWTDQTAAGSRSWKSITSSSDGTKLAAVVLGGDIWTSTTSGATWTDETAAGSQNWYSITSSSDGTKLAAVINGGDIWTSVDSGATWTDQTAAGSGYRYSITSSSDGTKLAAVINGGDIWTSTNSGATWTDQTAAGSRNWQWITSSSDGTKLAATVGSGDIWTSANSGATWTDETAAGSQNWYSITSSSDGTKLAAAPINADIWTAMLPSVPSVTTSSVSSVSYTTATLNGSITNNGGYDASQSGFAYSTDPNLVTGVSTSTLGAETGDASFSQNLTGLTPGTAYYFRAYATNSIGTGFGSIVSFNASPIAGTLSCSIATSCSSGAIIYRMASTSNSHAELPSQSHYSNLVCCTGVTGLSNSCSGTYTTVLVLASTTNSHSGEYGVSSYPNNACISVPSGGTVSAGYTSSGTCTAAGYDTTLGSMISSNNSHVGSPNDYPIKICASATGSSITFTTDSPTESFGTVTPGNLYATSSILSAATTNTDGFNITIKRSNATDTMSSGSFYIPDKTDWVAPLSTTTAGNATASTTQLNTLQFRINLTGTDSPDYSSAWWGINDTTNAVFAGISSTTQMIIDRSTAAAATTTMKVLYYLDVPISQQSASYSGTLTYTITANI